MTKTEEESEPIKKHKIYMTQEFAQEVRRCLNFIRSKRNALLHLELLALKKNATYEEDPTSSTVESIQSTDLESVIDINVISPSDNSISDTEHSEADIELVLSMRYLENLEPSTVESLQSTDLESMIEINVISPSDDSIPDTEQPDISFLHEEYPEPSTTESLQSTDLESMIEINVISPSDDSIPDMNNQKPTQN